MSTRQSSVLVGILAGCLALLLAGCAGSSGQPGDAASGSPARQAMVNGLGTLEVKLTNNSTRDLYYTYRNWDGASDCCGAVLMDGVLRPGESIQRGNNNSRGTCDLFVSTKTLQAPDRYQMNFLGAYQGLLRPDEVKFGHRWPERDLRVNCESLDVLRPGGTGEVQDPWTADVYRWSMLPGTGNDTAVVALVVTDGSPPEPQFED